MRVCIRFSKLISTQFFALENGMEWNVTRDRDVLKHKTFVLFEYSFFFFISGCL